MLFALLVLCALPSLAQNPTKIAEGTYATLRGGEKVVGSEQEWSLWKYADGSFRLDDKFSPQEDGFDQLVSALATSRVSMDPKLRQQMQHRSQATGISMKLDAHSRPTLVDVAGINVTSKKAVTLAHCEIKDSGTTCKGDTFSEKARSTQQQFLFAFPFPMLFRPLLVNAPVPTEEFEAGVLSLDDAGAGRVTTGKARLKAIGKEPLKIGDMTFETDRYLLELVGSNDSLRLDLWASTQGLVLATRNQSNTNDMTALVWFKKTADF